MENNYILAIDGGATKTLIAIANQKGKILARKTCGSTNIYNAGEKTAEQNLKNGLSAFLKKYRIEKAVFGMASLNTKKDLAEYQKIVKKILPQSVKFWLFNDSKIALEALPKAETRLLIISGTGSNVYGESGSKKEKVGFALPKLSAKAGGWDFILADEGSSYSIGLAALKQTVKSFDGKNKFSDFERAVLKHSGKKNVLDLINQVYNVWQNNTQNFKTYIASFAFLVSILSQKDNPKAKKILKEAANELSLTAKVVIKKLGAKKKKICVGLVGSMFKNSLFKREIKKKIRQFAPKAYFKENADPIAGAINLALKLK